MSDHACHFNITQQFQAVTIKGRDDLQLEETQDTEREFQDFIDGADPMLHYMDAEDELFKLQTNNPLLQESNATQQSICYKNTYRIEPTKKFYPDKASKIIETILQNELQEAVYDRDFCSKVACELSERIKDQIKIQMDIPRYKLVSFVTVGQLRDQGMLIGSRCAWNEKFDNFASSSFKNTSLFAVGVIFVAYLE